VQGFYEKLLQEHVGGEVPVPAGWKQSLSNRVRAKYMRRWRRCDAGCACLIGHYSGHAAAAFTPETDPEIAEAVLRYSPGKKIPATLNRDKTDLVATFLYRHPRVPGQWERRGYGLDGSLPLSPFEIALIEILADSDVPSLPEEHVQMHGVSILCGRKHWLSRT